MTSTHGEGDQKIIGLSHQWTGLSKIPTAPLLTHAPYGTVENVTVGHKEECIAVTVVKRQPERPHKKTSCSRRLKCFKVTHPTRQLAVI